MSNIISRLFDSYDDASRAVRELESAGIPHANVSIVANNADDRHSGALAGSATTGSTTTGSMTAGSTGDHPTSPDAAGTGATVGTVLGGGAGLLAGLGMLAIPGVGPVVAAGWLVATALGAGVGAASGGLLGSLVGAGVDEADAHVYSEGVRRGGTLVTVRAEDGQGAMVEQILAKYSAVDATTRGAEYRAEGWSRFDETAPAYTAGGSPTLGTTAGTMTGTMPGDTTRPLGGTGAGTIPRP